MSPTKSDAERLAAIEALVCRDVGRKTQQMIEASTGELARAAAALAGATSVGLITGFFVPRGDVAAPETDGPVGTALLAAALAACGVPARIAVDTPCAGAVRAAIAAAGEGVAVDEVAVDDAVALERLALRWRDLGVSHAVAIERCGRSADGRPRNMRGVDVSAWTAPLDDLFLAGPWVKLAVGDGGNEMGMGALPPGLVAADMAEQLDHALDLEARRIGRHQEGTDAAATLGSAFGIGHGEDDAVVGDRGVRRPDLAAGQPPAIAIGSRASRQRRGVRTGAGLREAIRG